MADKLNGHTGIISQVWRKRALVKIKMIDADVGFDVDVVYLADGTHPESLLDNMKTGSTVHYNAESDDRSDHGYKITRVWFAGGSKAPTASKPVTALEEKALKSHLKAMLFANNCKLPLFKIHSLCQSSKNSNSHVYGDKIEGLKAYLTKRNNLFQISGGNVVTLIKEAAGPAPGGPPPTVCAPITEKVLKRQLKVLLKTNPAPMTLEKIHHHYSRKRPELSAAYKDSVVGLKAFVVARPTIFRLQGDLVSLLDEEADTEVTTQAEPDEYGLNKTVAHIKKLVDARAVVNLESLLNLLTSCDLEVRAHVGTTVLELRSFLQSQDDTFHVTPQGAVTLCDVDKREADKLVQQGAAKEMSKAAKKAKKAASAAKGEAVRPAPASKVVVAAGNPHMDSLNFLRNTLLKSGPLPVTKLIGHIGCNATEAIRDYVGGGTADGLLKFLQKHRDLFEIGGRGVCSILDGQADDVQQQPSMLAKRDGVVQHVTFTKTCGFIQNGNFDHDNIYFKPHTIVRGRDSYTGTGRLMGLDIGDSVDCLYELYLSKSCTYRAVGVWPTVDAGNGADSAFFNPISVIDAPILHGQGQVAFLMDGMGYLTVKEAGKADRMVIFHMGHIDYVPKYTWDILAEGSRVLFVAVLSHIKDESNRKGQAPTEVWHAIHLWPMSVQGSGGVGEVGTAHSTESWDGEVTVQELTSEGGRLAFGRDPYSERVTFTWRELLSRRDGDRGPQRIAPGYTLLCVATASPILAAIKWVASAVYRPDDPATPKHLQVHRSQRMEPPPRPVRRSGSNGIGALSAFLSGDASSSGSGGQPREEKNLLDLDDDDIPPLVNGSSDVSDCGAPLLNFTTTPGAVAQPMDPSKDDGDEQLPQNFDETDFIKEALDAGALYLAAPKSDGGDQLSLGNSRPAIVDGAGVVVATGPFGGVLESTIDKGRLVYFGAHSFFFRRSPIAHTAFKEGARVRFNAEYAGNGNYQASSVWIGQKPSSPPSRLGNDFDGLF